MKVSHFKMRILIFSDSHQNPSFMINAIKNHPDAKDIIFLGDGLSDITLIKEQFEDLNFYCVKGNCDTFSNEEQEKVLIFCQKKILITHGHCYNVKGGTAALEKMARDKNCDIVLYGHTHIADSRYIDGLFVLNPGSIGRGRPDKSFAFIDITQNGVMPVIVEI